MNSPEKVTYLMGTFHTIKKLLAKVGHFAISDLVSRRTTIKYFLGILVLLNILDALLSNILVTKQFVSEGNLLLMGVVGGPGFIVIKAIGAFLAALIIWDIYRHHSRLGYWTSAVCLLIYVSIVVWNTSLLLNV